MGERKEGLDDVGFVFGWETPSACSLLFRERKTTVLRLLLRLSLDDSIQVGYRRKGEEGGGESLRMGGGGRCRM